MAKERDFSGSDNELVFTQPRSTLASSLENGFVGSVMVAPVLGETKYDEFVRDA